MFLADEAIELEAFLSLTEETLKIFVPKYGHRYKILREINRLNTSTLDVSQADTVIIDDLLSPSPSVVFTDSTPPCSTSSTSLNEASCSTDDQNNSVPPLKRFKKGLYLQEFLSLSKIGAALIRIHELRHFTSNERSRLVHLIVDHCIECNDVLVNQDFNTIAENICDIFSTEVKGTYYLPPEGSKKIANGKLVDCYRNSRRLLRIKEDNKELSTSFDDTLQEKLTWLESNVAPWAKVEEVWKETRAIRGKITIQGGSVADVFKKYPALQQPLGYTLLEEEFNSNFPGRELSFVEKWPSMFPILWDICLQNKKSKISADYPSHDGEYI